jgi:uncharacterized protein (AIM24 family)
VVSDAELARLDGVTGDIATTDFVQTSVNTVSINTQTASYALALADSGKLIQMNVASGNNLTVPLDSSVAFPIGTKIDVIQWNTGQTTVVGAGGVTLVATPGAKLRARYSSATIVKMETNTWIVLGDLSA